MNSSIESKTKPVGTREWYDFVGLFSESFPGIHMGGRDATHNLLEMCKVSKDSFVLDVGCGGGHTACLIAEEYGAKVLGIDISDVMVSKAEERAKRMGLSKLLKFRTGDVYDLPFETNSFDVVLVESVLLPIPGNKSEALAEMVRVLKPDGYLGANEGTLDPDTPQEMLETLSRHPATYGRFTPASLKALFESVGLLEIKMAEAKNIEAPNMMKEMGCGGLLNFMFRVYPKIILKLLRDARFREATKLDDQVTKQGKEYMGYALIVGQKPQEASE